MDQQRSQLTQTSNTLRLACQKPPRGKVSPALSRIFGHSENGGKRLDRREIGG